MDDEKWDTIRSKKPRRFKVQGKGTDTAVYVRVVVIEADHVPGGQTAFYAPYTLQAGFEKWSRYIHDFCSNSPSPSIFNDPPLSIYRISGLSPANLSEHELHCMAYSCWLVEWRDIDWEARCRTIPVDCRYRENRNCEA